MLWIGIDVGGTFTDAVAYDQIRGAFTFAKVPSTPADPTRAVLEVLKAMQLDIQSIERLVHGVTIGTNAVLEAKGAEVWMLVTKGFKDVLEIGRTNRPVLYDIRTQKAPPLVPRTRALEIDERLLFDGSVLKPIDLTEVERVASGLPERRDAAVAICFLHSYANAAHELAAKATVTAARPNQFVCTSHEVLPQFREYERFNTTALNAYIGPLMDSYLTRLEAGLREHGFKRDLHIMTSTGGIATAARARRLPVSTVLSGPSAGVTAAVHLGAQLGIANIITCDMGGTSTDVCLIEGLKVPMTSEQKISHYSNRTPQIEINSVGAGGGSISLARCRRHSDGRPAKRRRQSRPRLLRPRRRGGHRHRRKPCPEPPVDRAACLRSSLARPGTRILGPGEAGTARGPRHPRARRRHCPHCRGSNGLGHQTDLDREWPRSA
jgi:N-methylhydantoinase A